MALSLRKEQQSGQDSIQAAAHMARLDYERQYRGRNLSERELCLILQERMQQWQAEGVPLDWRIDYITGWHAAILEDQQRAAIHKADEIARTFQTFGAFLRFLRERSHLLQTEVADEFKICKCPLDAKTYGKIERCERSPRFRELASLYKALVRAGVEIHPEERAVYVVLARNHITSKTQYKETVSAKQWEALTVELAKFDDSPVILMPSQLAAPLASAKPKEASAPPALLSQATQGSATEQQQLCATLLQTARELATMVAQLAQLSQQLQGGATC